MNFIVDGDNAAGSFVTCSTIQWKMAVPRDNTTLAYNLADGNITLRDVVERSVVESVGFFTGETWLESNVHAMETFSADSDEVSVWELKDLLLVGRLELCVVIHANVAQFLFDIPPSLRRQ